MGKHSIGGKAGKNRRIAVVSALVLAVATAIVLTTASVHKPADNTVAGGGGGSTGNSVTVD